MLCICLLLFVVVRALRRPVVGRLAAKARSVAGWNDKEESESKSKKSQNCLFKFKVCRMFNKLLGLSK